MPFRPSALTNPLTNRGTAFTRKERALLGLTGRLPSAVETLEQQAARAWKQLNTYEKDLEKYIFLDQLHNRNEVLYFKILTEHLEELLPIVYDPTIGEAIKKWSYDYRRSRAVYLSIDHPEEIRASFETLGLGRDDVDLIVVSDAEQILGIGDWGVNGTDISVGKLAVYTAGAGVDPSRVIAVNLDVGTNNETLLKDPYYLGSRHARVRGQAYDDMIHGFLQTVSDMYPHALIHFEDFGPSNARRILTENAGQYCIFNDDLQGTAAIVMAAVMSGLKITKKKFSDQRLLVYGAGTAGSGMADQISAAMIRDGLTQEEAVKRVWLIDINGLVTSDMEGLPDYQRAYARDPGETEGWNRKVGRIGLLETIRRVKPTILIGTSTDHGAFTKEVIEALCAGTDHPMLFPLSNLTEKIEIMPEEAVTWSQGKALVACGIPSRPVSFKGTEYHIGQANNALLYPGLGLGVIASGASRVTDHMLLASSEAVASAAHSLKRGDSLLPPVHRLREVSVAIAAAVIQAAVDDGVSSFRGDPVKAVKKIMWEPVYKEL